MGDETTDLNADNNTGNYASNPAWNDFLGAIPSQFHEVAIPHLKKWDEDVQNLTNKIHSEYEQWKPFKEQGIDPSNVSWALNFVNALQEDPKKMVDALSEYYKLNGVATGTETSLPNLNPTLAAGSGTDQQLDPRVAAELQSIKDNERTIASFLLKSQEEARAAQEDARLDAEYKQLHAEMSDKHGFDFDEEVVNGIALGKGISIQQAANEYYETLQKVIAERQRPAPRILGPGGSLPSVRKPIKGMAESEVRSTALDFLNAHLPGS